MRINMVSLKTVSSVFLFCLCYFVRPSFEQDGSSCNTPEKETGVCTAVKKCPSVYSLATTRGKEAAVAEYLRQFQCPSSSSKNYIVCCPRSGVVVYPPTVTTTIGSSTSPRNLQTVCGVPGTSVISREKIVGGRNSTLGDWPWMAALMYQDTSGPLSSKCGSALITNQHVITAAHCVSNLGTLKLTSVRLGDLNLDSNVANGASPVEIGVANVIPHPRYTTSPILNDIAIVKLNNPVAFTDLIKPICLLEEEIHRNSSFYKNRRPAIAGWGALEWRGPTSNLLQDTTVHVVENGPCATAYAKQYSAKIDDSVICAGKTGRDTCQGDSGGPLMFQINSTYYLGGVVSYGYKCADPNYPGVYTKVAYFEDWIRQNTKS